MTGDLGLIETVRVRQGAAPLWHLHLSRLYQSCRDLGVPAPRELTVPAGGADRVHRLEVRARGAAAEAAVTVTTREVGPVRPVHLVTSRVVHRPYPHKTTERAQFDQALAEARAAGADDALMLDAQGYVTEAAIWTLFWWEGTHLVTPALALGVLPGVARARIAELVPLAERRVPRESLTGRSLLVANAVRGIVEVATLDGAPVPTACGTAELRERFWFNGLA